MLQFLPRLPGDEPGDPGRTMIKTDILFHLISPFLKTRKAQGAIQAHQADRDVRFLFANKKKSPGVLSARQRGGTMSRSARWPYVRRMAWDRDRKAKNVCHICGQSIDYFLEPSSCDEAWEPDHIIPVARAPELELDLGNIKASHRRCNRARGDGTNGENAIGMQSRIW